jgi:hypothetical protein
MSQIEIPPSECIFQSIVGFMLPFFLVGAGGDPDLAHAAIVELIDAYAAATLRELDLVGCIISFNLAAMDDLRRSMSDPDMSDAKVLRYRSNAVALSRSAERCRQTLEVMQAKRQLLPRPVGVVPSALVAAAVVVEAPVGRPVAAAGSDPVCARAELLPFELYHASHASPVTGLNDVDVAVRVAPDAVAGAVDGIAPARQSFAV